MARRAWLRTEAICRLNKRLADPQVARLEEAAAGVISSMSGPRAWSSSMRVGLYPGSFDPVTYGHVDIVRRAAHLVDKLVIAIGTHHDKHPLFTAEERVKLAEEVLKPVAKEVGLELEVSTYDNLTVDAARDAGASVVIRGLRDAGDFDYEMQMAGMNQALAPAIETVFLASSPDSRHIAASLVRQIAAMDGDVSAFVPKVVSAALQKKFAA
jgi:pantetheine-phosphate adenylyltransferase